ncbi:uncharacterized protein IL334_005504 [Kwoniella shivajii]|uniref:Uncharacterized protein n=1 Tax=Kwoniella shivajii TaxID=564305 RepID=A0ABZ1D3D0_9TREE|nr:hypothetical protein IL334_005504 [Kwoniella shivajii]
MKLISLLSFLVIGNVAHATYCGVVTDTYTKTKYSTSHAPAVTSTHTRKIPVCFETETITKTKTKHVDTTTYSTTTKHKTETETHTARPVWTTTTSTRVIPTCTPRQNKRSFLDSLFEENQDQVDERELQGLTNGERIQRGLPLAKPNHNRKRSPQAATIDLDLEVDAQGRKHPHPSCYPSHTTQIVTITKGKTITPTQWTTTSKCARTKTVDEVVTTKTTITDVHTETGTKRGQPVIITENVTPTHTQTSIVTSRSITGACRPTHY